MRSVYLFALFCISSLAFAQDRPAAAKDEDLRLKVFTRMVQVPVTVTDDSGKVVTGLKQEDFVLTEEGKEQRIAAFESVTTVHTPIQRRKLEPGLYTNRLLISEGQRSVVVMVLDTVNTPITDQAYTRAQMIKYLSESVQPDTLLSIRVISQSGVRIITDFTTDTRLLIAALQRAKNDIRSPSQTPDQTPSIAPSEGGFNEVASTDVLYQQLQSLAQDTNRDYETYHKGIALLDTMSALRSVAQSLAGIPGRKAIIWATAGFPFYFEDTRGFSSNLYGQRFARMIQEFNDLNISVYPVDARGLLGKLSERASEFSSQGLRGPDMRRSDVRAAAGFGVGSPQIGTDPLDTLRYMADVTGGVAYVNTNDLANSFRKAAEDSSSYYLLSYYLTRPQGAPPEWRKIKVKVKQPGLNVRTRSGIFAVPKPLDLPGVRDTDLGLAQRSPTNMTGMGMVVDWLPDPAKPSDPSKFFIQVNASDVTINEPENLLSVDFLVVVRGADGKLLDQVAKKVEGKVKSLEDFRKQPMLFSGELKPIKPGAIVRFIVRDNLSGKLGTVIVDTEAVPPKT